MTQNKVWNQDQKIEILEKKRKSNFSIGKATTETLLCRFLSCLFCRLLQADVCSDDPVTQKILEATMGVLKFSQIFELWFPWDSFPYFDHVGGQLRQQVSSRSVAFLCLEHHPMAFGHYSRVFLHVLDAQFKVASFSA